MREVRLALLEADVSYKVVKDFVSQSHRARRRRGRARQPHPRPAGHQDRQRGADRSDGRRERASSTSPPSRRTRRHDGRPAGRGQNHQRRPSWPVYCASRASARCWPPATSTVPPPSSSCEVVGAQLGRARCSRWGRATPWTSPRHAVEHAKDHGNDMVFLDTAGRLHIDEALMDELQAHQGGGQAQRDPAGRGRHDRSGRRERRQPPLTSALGIDGVMLTKLDGDARGGAALSIQRGHRQAHQIRRHRAKSSTSIEPFHPDRMASRILGMGDVLTLIEKAEQHFDEEKAEEARGKAQEEPLHPAPITMTSSCSCAAWATSASSPSMMPGGMGKQLARRRDRRQGHARPHRGHHPLHDP